MKPIRFRNVAILILLAIGLGAGAFYLAEHSDSPTRQASVQSPEDSLDRKAEENELPPDQSGVLMDVTTAEPRIDTLGRKVHFRDWLTHEVLQELTWSALDGSGQALKDGLATDSSIKLEQLPATSLTLLVQSPGYAERIVPIAELAGVVEDTTYIDLIAHRSTEVVVQTQDRIPLGAIAVAIEQVPNTAPLPDWFEWETPGPFLTRDDGVVGLGRLPLGAPIRLRLSEREIAAGRDFVVEGGPGEFSHVVIAAPETALIGRLVDSSGMPVAGEVITAMKADGDQEWTRTKVDGTFRYTGIEAGTYRVEASRLLSEGATCVVAEEATADVGDIVVLEHALISGIVVGRGPCPCKYMSNIWVTATSPDGEISRRINVGPTGTFELEVTAGPWRLAVLSGSGHGQQELSAVDVVAPRHELELDAGGLGAIVVPISKDYLEVMRSEATPSDWQWPVLWKRTWGCRVEDREWAVPSLKAGAYDLWSDAGVDGALWARGVVVTPGESIAISSSLIGFGQLTVEGVAMGDAFILYEPSGGFSLHELGEDGRSRLTLPAGPYGVGLLSPTPAFSDLHSVGVPASEEVFVQLPERDTSLYGRCRFHITTNGQGTPEAKVRIMRGSDVDLIRATAGVFAKTTSETGYTDYVDLAEGPYWASVRSAGVEVLTAFDVSAGQTSEIEVAIPVDQYKVKVLGPDGTFLPGHTAVEFHSSGTTLRATGSVIAFHGPDWSTSGEALVACVWGHDPGGLASGEFASFSDDVQVDLSTQTITVVLHSYQWVRGPEGLPQLSTPVEGVVQSVRGNNMHGRRCSLAIIEGPSDGDPPSVRGVIPESTVYFSTPQGEGESWNFLPGGKWVRN